MEVEIKTNKGDSLVLSALILLFIIPLPSILDPTSTGKRFFNVAAFWEVRRNFWQKKKLKLVELTFIPRSGLGVSLSVPYFLIRKHDYDKGIWMSYLNNFSFNHIYVIFCLNLSLNMFVYFTSFYFFWLKLG